MKRTAAIGVQDFGELIRKHYFYVDKTVFIKEWWENGDSVTLITRPRRFGKTLTMSMLDYFFSNKHRKEQELFSELAIWKYEDYQKLQGTYPVIKLSFANVKGTSFETVRRTIFQLITNLYSYHSFLLESDVLTKKDREYFERISVNMHESDAELALYQLSDFLSRYYGKKVLIFLDEYDTPMQEAYVNGFWKELVGFIRGLFNSTFKTNPYMERALMTGITRVSKESFFSDLNNLEVVTTTSEKYESAFGFTEKEVFLAMDEFGLKNKEEVKAWYDGFIFGNMRDMYNPWSIINFLGKGKLDNYWVNTAGNKLIGKLIREGNAELKIQFEQLLLGEAIESDIDEEIVYDQLDDSREAVFSLLLAGGYLKVLRPGDQKERTDYVLTLTNKEVQRSFERMVKGWFQGESAYNNFIKALLLCDRKAMNNYMNRVALRSFSYFDTGSHPSEKEPERFYHGFVLGLLVELSDRYAVESNRESGFGRYDVLITPHRKEDKAYILEFKVYDPEDEKSLKDTVASALAQIEEKQYEQTLLAHGIQKENIRKYGFAFRGSEVLIGDAEYLSEKI